MDWPSETWCIGVCVTPCRKAMCSYNPKSKILNPLRSPDNSINKINNSTGLQQQMLGDWHPKSRLDSLHMPVLFLGLNLTMTFPKYQGARCAWRHTRRRSMDWDKLLSTSTLYYLVKLILCSNKNCEEYWPPKAKSKIFNLIVRNDF